MDQRGWDASEVTKWKIHARYILFLLLSLIVGLVSVNWSDVPRLPEYFSFASTLASLILAVLAIAYAIYSSSSLERNINSLVRMTDQVQSTATTLSSSSQSLSLDIRRLADITTAIDARTQSMEAAIEKKQRTPRTRKAQQPSAQQTEGPKNVVELAAASSISGAIALYATTAAFLSKEAFSLSEMEKFKVMTATYTQGFLIGAALTGLIDGEITPERVMPSVVVGASEDALLEIEADLLKYLDAKEPELKESLVADFESSKGYLSSIGIGIPTRKKA